jgi:AAA+ ATPase superfamily predicted ATPase
VLKFVNRDAEIWQLRTMLDAPPNTLLFVYGPKSSGKSTLMMKISKMYPGDVVFYDFRARSPAELHRVLAVQRPGFATRVRNYFRRKVQGSNIWDGIELRESQLKLMAQGKLDPFAPLIEKLKKFHRPVLVLDEIQNLKHSGLDNEELSQVLNFLVTLTKRLHLAHVIVVTSDCLFIDEIARLASLEETADYLYVGDLPQKNVIEWLKGEGMSEDKAQEVYSRVGGRPYDIWIAIQHFRATEDTSVLGPMIRRKASRVKLVLKSAGAKEQRLVKRLAKGPLSLGDIHPRVLKWAVENEIAFFDPVNGEVYALSRSMQQALREV